MKESLLLHSENFDRSRGICGVSHSLINEIDCTVIVCFDFIGSYLFMTKTILIVECLIKLNMSKQRLFIH